MDFELFCSFGIDEDLAPWHCVLFHYFRITCAKISVLLSETCRHVHRDDRCAAAYSSGGALWYFSVYGHHLPDWYPAL